MGFPCGSAGKESACNVGDLGSIPGLGRSSGEWNGYPLRYSGLENSMDCIVHGVTKSQKRLSNFHYHYLVLIDGTVRGILKPRNSVQKHESRRLISSEDCIHSV